jgi:hypothetical protein
VVPRVPLREQDPPGGGGGGGGGGGAAEDSLKGASVKERARAGIPALSKKYRTGGSGREKRKGVGPGRDLPRTRESGCARVSVSDPADARGTDGRMDGSHGHAIGRSGARRALLVICLPR